MPLERLSEKSGMTTTAFVKGPVTLQPRREANLRTNNASQLSTSHSPTEAASIKSIQSTSKLITLTKKSPGDVEDDVQEVCRVSRDGNRRQGGDGAAKVVLRPIDEVKSVLPANRPSTKELDTRGRSTILESQDGQPGHQRLASDPDQLVQRKVDVKLTVKTDFNLCSKATPYLIAGGRSKQLLDKKDLHGSSESAVSDARDSAKSTPPSIGDKRRGRIWLKKSLVASAVSIKELTETPVKEDRLNQHHWTHPSDFDQPSLDLSLPSSAKPRAPAPNQIICTNLPKPKHAIAHRNDSIMRTGPNIIKSTGKRAAEAAFPAPHYPTKYRYIFPVALEATKDPESDFENAAITSEAKEEKASLQFQRSQAVSVSCQTEESRSSKSHGPQLVKRKANQLPERENIPQKRTMEAENEVNSDLIARLTSSDQLTLRIVKAGPEEASQSLSKSHFSHGEGSAARVTNLARFGEQSAARPDYRESSAKRVAIMPRNSDVNQSHEPGLYLPPSLVITKVKETSDGDDEKDAKLASKRIRMMRENESSSGSSVSNGCLLRQPSKFKSPNTAAASTVALKSFTTSKSRTPEVSKMTQATRKVAFIHPIPDNAPPSRKRKHVEEQQCNAAFIYDNLNHGPKKIIRTRLTPMIDQIIRKTDNKIVNQKISYSGIESGSKQSEASPQRPSPSANDSRHINLSKAVNAVTGHALFIPDLDDLESQDQDLLSSPRTAKREHDPLDHSQVDPLEISEDERMLQSNSDLKHGKTRRKIRERENELICCFCKSSVQSSCSMDHLNTCVRLKFKLATLKSCPFCAKVSKSIKAHILTEHERKKAKCEYCGVRFFNLENHQDKYHKFEHVTTCDLCGKTVKYLNTHTCPFSQKSGRDQCVECPSCGNLVKRKYLKIHQNKHCVGQRSSSFSNFRTEGSQVHGDDKEAPSTKIGSANAEAKVANPLKEECEDDIPADMISSALKIKLEVDTEATVDSGQDQLPPHESSPPFAFEGAGSVRVKEEQPRWPAEEDVCDQALDLSSNKNRSPTRSETGDSGVCQNIKVKEEVDEDKDPSAADHVAERRNIEDSKDLNEVRTSRYVDQLNIHDSRHSPTVSHSDLFNHDDRYAYAGLRERTSPALSPDKSDIFRTANWTHKKAIASIPSDLTAHLGKRSRVVLTKNSDFRPASKSAVVSADKSAVASGGKSAVLSGDNTAVLTSKCNLNLPTKSRERCILLKRR